MCYHKIAKADLGNWSITICCKHLLVRRHAIVIRDLVSRPSSSKDASPWHKLEVSERLVKALLPIGLLFFCLLNSSYATCHSRPCLLWIELQWLPAGILEGVSIHEDFLANAL